MSNKAPVQHTVDIDGVPVNYYVAGSGPVCLVHPGGPGLSWGYLRMPAVEEHLTTVYLEPIGTGASGRLPGHPHGYTRGNYARAVAGVLAHLDLSSVHLLGHSHGGFVAQYCAHSGAQHLADRLSGVVLYASSPMTGPDFFAAAGRNVDEFARRNADNPDLPHVLEAWRSLPTAADDEGFTRVARGILPLYVADFWGRAAEYAEFAASISGFHISDLDDGVPDLFDDRPVLDSIGVDTLVVVGRHDFLCGPRWGDELHRGIPGSKLIVLEDSGHFGHVEQPADFAAAVVEFVLATTP